MNSIKVIIVEDELIAAEFLKEILEENGAEVIDIIDTGKEAIRVCIEKQPDIVFMDIMLRDNISGSEAAFAISRKNTDIKIIFLTAYIDQEMVDFAIDSKAAAYLTKPYNEAQIIATYKLALTSRKTTKIEQKPDKIYLINDYVFHMKEKRLIKNAKEIELGTRSLRLLELLCLHPDISVSNEQISMHVWNELVDDKTLRSLIFRIRSATDKELIKNVSGTGYMIQTKF